MEGAPTPIPNAAGGEGGHGAARPDGVINRCNSNPKPPFPSSHVWLFPARALIKSTRHGPTHLLLTLLQHHCYPSLISTAAKHSVEKREMGWWKADPVPSPSQTSPPSIAPSSAPAVPAFTPLAKSTSACPVDPKAREVWLQKAKLQSKSQFQTQPIPDSHPPILSEAANTFAASPSSTQCSSDTITQYPHPQSSITSPLPKGFRPLSHDRVVSSIPRANPVASPNMPTTSPPSNSETETGADSTTGNWIYPSEHQFFTAVLRKNSLPTSSPDPSSLASTVPSIIPIHNAVNERAWALIKEWEGDSSASCGGPKLLSFRGLGAGPDEEPGLLGGLVGYARLFDPRTCLSPRARVRALGGYQAPFDRHDWVVERCGGEKVEYVIDFYQGKSKGNEGSAGGGLNFYLDVRPKLNSWEGWRMRGARLMGFEESKKGQKTV